MNIETGDFFVVTRGFPFSNDTSLDLILGNVVTKEKRQEYDRSHEGDVFQAVEVCGPVNRCQACV